MRAGIGMAAVLWMAASCFACAMDDFAGGDIQGEASGEDEGDAGLDTMYAYSTTPFYVSDLGVVTKGTITWYNRSVGVTGTVTDTASNAYCAVGEFQGWRPKYAPYFWGQTRTICGVGKSRSFAFTIDASAVVGGITHLVISAYEVDPTSAYNRAHDEFYTKYKIYYRP